MINRINRWDVVGLFLWILVMLYWGILERSRGIGYKDAFVDGLYYGTLAYCVLIIPTCWVFVKTNKAVIYQNSFVREPDLVDDLRVVDTLVPPAGQLVMGAGPHFRIPFLHRLYREPINMVSGEPLTDTIDVYDINNQKASLTWIAGNTPMPNKYLPNWYRVFRKTAEATLKTEISDRIQEIVKGETIEWTILDRGELNEEAEEVMGGIDVDSDEEKRVGTRTGKIYVSNIILSPETLAVANAAYKLKLAKAEAENLRQAGVSADLAMATAAKAFGIDINIINVAGLGGTGVGAGAQTLVTADVIERMLRQGQTGTPTPP